MLFNSSLYQLFLGQWRLLEVQIQEQEESAEAVAYYAEIGDEVKLKISEKQRLTEKWSTSGDLGTLTIPHQKYEI